jgi:TetR/AcrR family transcriptional regulator of autoinduction and epiphytic fitness
LEKSPIMSMQAAAPDNPSTPRVDGRNLRAETTRRKIIHGARALVEEQARLPKVADVARRSDVSVRSVFQHYQDVETLFIAVVDAIADDLEETLKEIDADIGLEERVRSLTAQQAALYEQMMPAVLAGRQLNPPPAALVERVEQRRNNLRRCLEHTFRSELSGLDPSVRGETLQALQAVAGWDCWISMRQRQGLGQEQATTTMDRLILAVLWSATNNVGLMVT